MTWQTLDWSNFSRL